MSAQGRSGWGNIGAGLLRLFQGLDQERHELPLDICQMIWRQPLRVVDPSRPTTGSEYQRQIVAYGLYPWGRPFGIQDHGDRVGIVDALCAEVRVASDEIPGVAEPLSYQLQGFHL